MRGLSLARSGHHPRPPEGSSATAQKKTDARFEGITGPFPPLPSSRHFLPRVTSLEASENKMTAWQAWLLVGLVLLGLEVLTPSFLLGAVAVAAFLTAAATLLGIDLTAQLYVFAAAALATLALIRPLVLRYLSRGAGEAPEAPLAALVGSEARVVVAIDPALAEGRVEASGTTWEARSAQPARIGVGARVRIVAVEDLTLTVQPLEKETN